MRVSIVTQVLNQSDYLRKMIASVRAQTLEDWELIVVDDGSEENIRALVDDYHDPRLSCVRFPENRGIPHGLNHAATLAVGDYIQPLSADEWISPDKLRVQVEYLDAHPEIGCVWGLPQSGPMGPLPSHEQYRLRAHNRSREAWIRTLLRFESIPIGGASMLMRREIWQEIGGFDQRFFQCSDLELFVRFFQRYQGHIMCHRFADADQPPTRLTAPSPANTERFQADVKLLHATHDLVLPPTDGRLTVGIPVYNMAQYIGKTLESLAAQTRQDFDVIVFDDGSTDDLPAALAGAHTIFADRLRFVRVETNAGVRTAVNALIGLCETDFFCSLAADDWVEPTFVERCLAEFVKDPYLEFVATQTDFADAAGAILAPGTHVVQGIPKALNRSREDWLNVLYYGNHYFGAGVYRHSVLAELGGFQADGLLMDYDMYLRLLQRENIKVIEEPLTHTRIHDGNLSMGPGKIDPVWLRAKYHEIKSRYFAPKPKIVIATPFYEMKGYSPYIASLAQTIQVLTKFGIDHEWWELSGDSYVDRAKNTLFSKFLEDPAATDLFMIDSDMQWSLDGFLGILQMPEEIVQGSYPQKNAWNKFTAVPELMETEGKSHPIGRMLPNGSALIKAAFLAGGFIRIRRSALEKYRDHFTTLRYKDAGADPTMPDREYVQFFNCELRTNEAGQTLRWGEDRIFGLRMLQIGVESWIYPAIDFVHYGVKGWHGNYHRFLKDGAQVEEARGA